MCIDGCSLSGCPTNLILKDLDEAKKRLSVSEASTASVILSNGVKIIDTFYISHQI